MSVSVYCNDVCDVLPVQVWLNFRAHSLTCTFHTLYVMQYEPELFPGLIYRLDNPRVVILIFVSGKIVVTGARSRTDILDGVQKIYPVLFKFRKAPSMGGSGATASGSAA